jgi:anti-sigma factor (TIGR02949 family)
MTKNFSMTDFDCTKTLRQLDFYMDDALDASTTGALLRHLDTCPSCYHELELRRQFRGRLKQATASTLAPAHLATRVLANVRAVEQQPRWMMWKTPIAVIAAVLVIAVGSGVAYQLGHLRFTSRAQESYIATISQQVAGIMSVGLRDHVHCGVFRKYPKNPPAVESFAADLTPEYLPLVNALKSALPSDYAVYVAHKCRYHGRRYVHLSLKNDSKLVSLIIAQKENGESFRSSNLLPVAENAGVQLYGAGVQRFQITGFETQNHLAYFISDLTKEQNTQLMAALAPSVRALLQKIES